MAGGVGGLGEGGSEFGGVMIAEDEECAEGRGEGFEEALEVDEGFFPAPGAVAEVTGDDEDVGLDFRQERMPAGELLGPACDVEVREVEDG